MMGKAKTRFNRPPLTLPVCLVGANVNGRPNFEAIAWFNLADYNPYLISISSEKSHYTNKGIRKNEEFSINIPSTDMVAVTDYCGTYSGEKVDKSKVFDIFYGELKNALMISECPINVECKLTKTIELLHGEVFIGEIAGVYIEEKYLTGNKPDIRKIDPLIFEEGLGNYWKLGEHIGKIHNTGKDYKPKSK
jgi:flavin reductase (DIM6/NTAB) family NADH-FMN oxidoreductase RutF